MIPNGEGWHYLAVKTLSALIRRIMSKHHCDCYCLNCLHFLQQKTNANLKKKKKSIRKLIFVIYGDFSMSTILFFKSIQNKHDLYRRKNWKTSVNP